MPSLRDLQRGFSAAALFGDAAAVAALGIVPGELDPPTRIAIYRNNILGNYRKILGATFPVVRRLVGRPFFDEATDQFVRGHPSARGDVNHYGGDFAAFLASYPPARGLSYLGDVARLEWAVDQANIAADAAPLDISALADVAPDALAELRFGLHPAVRLIASSFPILRIWEVNQPEYVGDPQINLDQGADTLLITRGADGIAIERIGKGEHAFLGALAANATLGDATTQATAGESAFNLAEALRRHVANQVVVAFRAPPTPARRELA